MCASLPILHTIIVNISSTCIQLCTILPDSAIQVPHCIHSSRKKVGFKQQQPHCYENQHESGVLGTTSILHTVIVVVVVEITRDWLELGRESTQREGGSYSSSRKAQFGWKTSLHQRLPCLNQYSCTCYIPAWVAVCRHVCVCVGVDVNVCAGCVSVCVCVRVLCICLC